MNVDWDNLRLRLRENRAAFESVSAPDPHQTRAVFRDRARKLARRAEAGQTSPAREILVFELGKDRYGLDLSHLVEAIPHPLVSPVPGASPQLAGVIQVRGEIRPVWELSRILGLADLDAEDSGWILLLRQGSREVGVRVSRVEDVRTYKAEECGPPRDGSQRVECITSDLVAVLNPNKLFTEEI